MITYENALELLKEKGQEHVLKSYDHLDEDNKKALLKQIDELDFELIEIAKNHQKMATGQVEPLPAMEINEIEENKKHFEEVGIRALKEGKFACVLLAGGMGTRLGFDKPKGELDFGETRTIYLFQRLVENLKDVCSLAGGCDIPLYIMTSEKNDEETRSFFEAHDYFGYKKENIDFFIQEMAAAVDYDGKLLMEEPGRLATSPNGNGGWFSSMLKAGLDQDMHRRGVEWVNIFSVDNPLQKMADPVFLGATIEKGADAGSKVVRKAYPEEKMGVMCKEDGRPSVIEYYELSDDMRNAVDDKGTLLYGFGVILNYIFKLDRLEEINSHKLPTHVVEKKIPFIDDNGNLVKPEEPNGYKFEKLAVDMIRLMQDCLPFEVVREKEFAPIKNLHGKDSLDSARELLKLNGEIL